MDPENVIKKDVTEEVSFVEKYARDAYDYVINYAPKLFMALVVLLVGLWIIKHIVRLSEKAMQRRDLEISLRVFLKTLTGISLKIILLITVAGMIGIQTTSLVTVLGAAGLAVGLALQGSLSNFAGGVLILVLKPYKVGDTIEALGQKGEVREIQIFNTIMVTGENRTVILPNGSVSNSLIVNQSRQGTLRGSFDVTISNEHDAERIRKIILEIIHAESRVVNIPLPPAVICIKSSGFGYTLQARFFTKELDNGLTVSALTEQVNKELTKRGIAEPLQKMVVYRD